ncbi:11737_t:CDS:2 [Acaulospora colombiana]|uniref:11737_t:CDS:1 n=1 Tax=Acaulospora colombiana TaxID=27376 RepID=A0ACA9JVB8_9GLOM|nr:11737_t:CDS:2 [Acaulospora colombiana]
MINRGLLEPSICLPALISIHGLSVIISVPEMKIANKTLVLWLGILIQLAIVHSTPIFEDTGDIISNLSSVDLDEPLEINLYIRSETRAPGGVARQVVTVNRRFPGPEISVYKGQKLKIWVHNLFGNGNVSLHWHGLPHFGSPFMDGAPYVTQCSIKHGYSFAYEIVARYSGTYWYHGHYFTQLLDGLYGPLIVKDTKDQEIFGYDDETTIIMSDWYYDMSEDVSNTYANYIHYNSYANPIPEPVPDNGLINGKNGECPRQYGCESNDGFSEFIFKQGKRIRIRLINASSLMSFLFTIDDHLIQIIEVEGTIVKPSENLHFVAVGVSQRYSIIISQANSSIPTNNYWMRAIFQAECLRSTTPQEELKKLPKEVKAIVRYDPDDKSLPRTQTWVNESVRCIEGELTGLVPYYEQNVLDPTVELKMQIIMDVDSPEKNETPLGSIATLSRGFNPPVVFTNSNTILELYRGAEFPVSLNSYTFEAIEVVDIFLISNENLNSLIFYQ